jgi:minor extracellular serine protease Vpr
VLNKRGSGPSDLIARALEEAVNDGFDVANLSLGSSADPTLDLLALAVENAVAAGMVVVVSAGNSGDQGRATIGTPGIAPSAITVGSTSNAHIVGPGAAVSVSGGAPASLTNIKSTQGDGASGSVGQFMVGPLPGVDVNALDAGGRGCGGLPGGSLAGKIALVERGNCNFSDKVNNAGAAGAVATIIFNKDLSEGSDGGDNLIFMSVPGTTIPSVFITRATGLALRDWLQTHPNAPVTIAPIPLADFPATADALSSFSSRGPSALGALKPDVSAPGDPVYSGAIKTANNSGVSDPSGFAAVSGTSQAAPHVAGSAALLLQLNPSWTPAQIKSALTSSADIQVFADSTASSTAGVLETGGGRIDLAKAGLATATFLPTNISFGFIKFKKKDVTRSMEVQIANVGGAQNKFTIAVEELNPGVGFTVTPSADSTTLAAGQSSTFSISVHATGKVAQRRDYTGYIVVTDESSSVLRLPYWVLLAKKKP